MSEMRFWILTLKTRHRLSPISPEEVVVLGAQAVSAVSLHEQKGVQAKKCFSVRNYGLAKILSFDV